MRNPEMEDYQDTEALSDRFPIGMRVLVVDDDPLCLMILKKMLIQCKYNVTACSRAIEALQLLREKKFKFDLVMSDVYMPDIDGFKLLELIGLEMDLPVIMMSANGETNVVMKGITHGACDYLLKPVRIEELRNIWQHVVRKRGTRDVVKEESSGEWDESEKSFDSSSEYSSKKRKEKFEPDEDQIDDISGLKKARVVWSGDLHRLFVKAVNQLGVEKAVPKRILDIMNVQGLTRENVASHLQKYRLGLKRLSGVDIEPHPIASFQADEGGNFGGSMYVKPGGSKSTSSRSSSSTGVFGKSVNQLDSGTLAALKQLEALQQKGAGNHVKSPRAVKSRHTGFQSQKGLGLQRTSSIELGSLMQDQWTSAWQQHGPRSVKKELVSISSLEMKGDTDLSSPGSGSTVEDMETITGFKEVRLEDPASQPFGLSRIAEESGGSELLSGTENICIPEHDLSDFCLGNSDYFAASPSAFSMSQVFSQQQENWSTDY